MSVSVAALRPNLRLARAIMKPASIGRAIGVLAVAFTGFAGPAQVRSVILGILVTQATGPTSCLATGHAGEQSGLSAGHGLGMTAFLPYVATTTHLSLPCKDGYSGAPPTPVTPDLGKV